MNAPARSPEQQVTRSGTLGAACSPPHCCKTGEVTERQHTGIRPADIPLVNDAPHVAGLLRDPAALAALGPLLAAPWADAGIDVVIAPEARGPIIGALVANELGAGLVLLRKEGQNHPGADTTVTSAPTWRGEQQVFRARSFDFDPGTRVIAVDDWITTGNSIRAARDAALGFGAVFVGTSAVVDKTDAATRAELNVHTLVAFDAILDAPRDDGARPDERWPDEWSPSE